MPFIRPSPCNGEPPRDCALCPRLSAFIKEQRDREPDWFNAPVPTFGDPNARLMIVGLAPGLQGANRTGRPFTGDYAGDLLYSTLQKFGFSIGEYAARADDGLILTDCAITNSVRCVPPANRPTPAEIATCRRFLAATLAEYESVIALLALGRIAHESVFRTLGLGLKQHPFSHGAVHQCGDRRLIFDSYHCSRYNTNTGRLTTAMFEDVFVAIRAHLDA
ncbi:MAG: uracil-DNA glycosylase [Rhizobiales bacterium]|nr:uracil-DNA glycosylase [Hyphomicrobiales bacterium]